MLLYDRNIIGASSEIFVNLRKMSEKMFGVYRLTFGAISENLRKSLENGWKSSDSGRKSSKSGQKRRH